MAKLSARNRTEIFRVQKENIKEGERYATKYTLAIMSDRHLLEKMDFWIESSDPKDDYKHSSGWRDKGKIKATLSFEEAKNKLLATGWTEVKK